LFNCRKKVLKCGLTEWTTVSQRATEMGNCSSYSGCLGHRSKHCQHRLLKEHSGIQELGCPAVSGNEGTGLELTTKGLEKIPGFEGTSLHSAWPCRDTLIGSMTKQTKGESKEISKVGTDTDNISNIKPDSLQQFWLSVGRNCGCESGTGQEVTEITEVTETVITEIIEVTEFPDTARRSQSMKTAMAGILLCRKETMQVNKLFH